MDPKFLRNQVYLEASDKAWDQCIIYTPWYPQQCPNPYYHAAEVRQEAQRQGLWQVALLAFNAFLLSLDVMIDKMWISDMVTNESTAHSHNDKLIILVGGDSNCAILSPTFGHLVSMALSLEAWNGKL